jgi:hypothetical protein
LPVGFIKCDIEGGEAFIFEGALKTIESNIMDVMIEVHDGAIAKLFNERGYKTYLESAQSVDGMMHVLFSNRDKWQYKKYISCTATSVTSYRRRRLLQKLRI